jgi:hypothetical protein
VEIDPTVYDFARKYFALPSKHTPIIADAISYASELAKSGQKYDYVVHDVFTGGAEPVDLFTLEFLTDLHSILKPGGVIAIVGLSSYSLLSHPVFSSCSQSSLELRRRPSPPLPQNRNPHHPLHLPNLPYLPRNRRPHRCEPRFHQHGHLLH